MTSPASTCEWKTDRGTFSRRITGNAPRLYWQRKTYWFSFDSSWLCYYYSHVRHSQTPAVGTCKLFLIFFSMGLRCEARGNAENEEGRKTAWNHNVGRHWRLIYLLTYENGAEELFGVGVRSGTWNLHLRIALIDYSINMLCNT